ncbi:MAG TPA: sigma-70 family RNA polymerase sigma factor [Chitinophagaceae bacterium]|nr:sigma-70 family RNA polymerase sigma factor [Chitinophagaceae bacterium]
MSTESQNELIRHTLGKESRRLSQYISNRVANQQDAEDILQDVLYRFVSAMRLEPIEKTAAWLFRVAGNRIIDWYRKHKPVYLDRWDPEDEEDPFSTLYLGDLMQDGGESPEDLYMRNVIWTELNEALDELPAAQREVFVMHELEGKRFREISLLTGETVNTLLSRKRYAVQQLRDRLKDLYDDLQLD